jgi:hypothetical protein
LDLRELLTLTVSLARRIVAMRGFEVEVEKTEKPIQVRTDPFLLQNLIWVCLDFIMEACGSPESILLVPEATGDEARIRFRGMTLAPSASGFPTQGQEILCKAVGASISIIDGEVLLSIPRDVESAAVSPPRHEGAKKGENL